MTAYALGMLLMLGFITLLIIATIVLFMMESIALDEAFEDEINDTTRSLIPVEVPQGDIPR